VDRCLVECVFLFFCRLPASKLSQRYFLHYRAYVPLQLYICKPFRMGPAACLYCRTAPRQVHGTKNSPVSANKRTYDSKGRANGPDDTDDSYLAFNLYHNHLNFFPIPARPVEGIANMPQRSPNQGFSFFAMVGGAMALLKLKGKYDECTCL